MSGHWHPQDWIAYEREAARRPTLRQLACEVAFAVLGKLAWWVNDRLHGIVGRAPVDERKRPRGV